ncbi:MAG TPA: cyclic nucleotide-binding domain-containing protein [Terriglobales bacterium]|nr:cyclic nucleotide-binding domain-containing protein [Terriglobales bacterium]
METLQGILADHPFARGLKDGHLALLVGCASNIRFEADQVVFREGEEANQFYLIREGKMAIELFAAERGSINILTLTEGEVLGWSWLVPPYRWRFDARAIQSTRAIALDGKCLREKCERDHDLGYELLKRVVPTMEERLQATRLQLLNVYEVHT